MESCEVGGKVVPLRQGLVGGSVLFCFYDVYASYDGGCRTRPGMDDAAVEAKVTTR